MRRVVSFSFVVLTLLTHAAGAAQILGLDINGTPYDVTFHDNPASFNSLWDANGDGTVGDGSLGKAPEFWGDETGAIAAANAIIAALGSTGVTVAFYDGFLIPFGTQLGTTGLVFVQAVRDEYPLLLALDVGDVTIVYPDDRLMASGGLPWASFAASSVPLPFTPALLFVGALAAGVTHRIRRVN